jgi:hypothetical protein
MGTGQILERSNGDRSNSWREPGPFNSRKTVLRVTSIAHLKVSQQAQVKRFQLTWVGPGRATNRTCAVSDVLDGVSLD